MQCLTGRRKGMKTDCCGNCIWFAQEMTDVYGYCVKHARDPYAKDCFSGADACGAHVSDMELRHAVAVLMQHNRWRRDQHVPNHRKMVNAKDLGRAIDLVVDFTKTYME